MTISDEKYMDMAIREAKAAMAAGEIPIGAIITAPDGTVIGRGHNLTESLGDVTAHAEMQAITAAAATLGGKYLKDALYMSQLNRALCVRRRHRMESDKPHSLRMPGRKARIFHHHLTDALPPACHSGMRRAPG